MKRPGPCWASGIELRTNQGASDRLVPSVAQDGLLGLGRGCPPVHHDDAPRKETLGHRSRVLRFAMVQIRVHVVWHMCECLLRAPASAAHVWHLAPGTLLPSILKILLLRQAHLPPVVTVAFPLRAAP